VLISAVWFDTVQFDTDEWIGGVVESVGEHANAFDSPDAEAFKRRCVGLDGGSVKHETKAQCDTPQARDRSGGLGG